MDGVSAARSASLIVGRGPPTSGHPAATGCVASAPTCAWLRRLHSASPERLEVAPLSGPLDGPKWPCSKQQREETADQARGQIKPTSESGRPLWGRPAGATASRHSHAPLLGFLHRMHDSCAVAWRRAGVVGGSWDVPGAAPGPFGAGPTAAVAARRAGVRGDAGGLKRPISGALSDVRLLDGDKVGVGGRRRRIAGHAERDNSSNCGDSGDDQGDNRQPYDTPLQVQVSAAAVSWALVLSSSRRPASASVTLLPWLIWPCRMPPPGWHEGRSGGQVGENRARAECPRDRRLDHHPDAHPPE
jgi:hypothetical protein